MALEWQMNTSSAEAGAFAEMAPNSASTALESALHAEVYQFQQVGGTESPANRKPETHADQKPETRAARSSDARAQSGTHTERAETPGKQAAQRVEQSSGIAEQAPRVEQSSGIAADQRTGTSGQLEAAAIRQKLEAALSEKFPKEKDRASVLALMTTFEQRATVAKLTATQVSQTYLETLRLLEPDEKSTIPLDRRVQLARQVLRHAALPHSIDQGKHNTCLASSLEVRAYTRSPEKAAKLIADTATTNSFSTTDGTVISLDNMSMIPDEESKLALPIDGQRDYASQIFAVTANNVYWMRTTEDYSNSKPVERGTYRFAQIPDLRKEINKRDENGQINRELDFGERVLDMRSQPYNWVSQQPSVPAEKIEEVYAQITGDTTGGFMITANSKSLKVPNPVESAQQLKERIISLKERGLLPAILVVNTNNEPWNNYPGIWHAVNILDYDPKKDRLSMSDQYGKSSDKNMKAGELYQAARGPSGLRPPTLPPFMARIPGLPQGVQTPDAKKSDVKPPEPNKKP